MYPRLGFVHSHWALGVCWNRALICGSTKMGEFDLPRGIHSDILEPKVQVINGPRKVNAVVQILDGSDNVKNGPLDLRIVVFICESQDRL